MLTRLFRSLRFGPTRQPHAPACCCRPRSFAPCLEVLEGRALPSTLTVTTLRDSGVAGDGSLRGELAAAQPGDTIRFQPGLQGAIALGSTLTLSKNVTIQGNLDAASHPLDALDGRQQVRDVVVNQGVTAALSGLTIADGYAQYTTSDVVQGGGILNQGTLSVQNCTITGNSAGLPRAFGPSDAGFITGQGGGIFNLSTLAVQNSTLSGNTAGGWGEGGGLMNGQGFWVSVLPRVWKGATATLAGCTITGNTATTGGGIYELSAGGSLTLRYSIITANTATEDAGGVYMDMHTGSVLAAPVSASDTTLVVRSALYFAQGETIRLADEQMTVVGVDTLHNTLRVIRGVNQTTAADHDAGTAAVGLSTYLDAATQAQLFNNRAPDNADFDGVYLNCP
jgi:hypothetical protein